MTSWWKMAVGVVVSVVGVVFLVYVLPTVFHHAANNSLGLEQTRVRGSKTAEDSARRQWLTTYLRSRAVIVKEVDCRRVMEGEEGEVGRAVAAERRPLPLPADSHVYFTAQNCSRFVVQRGFIEDSLTPLEQRYPIAFSIVAFQHAAQVVDLLRAIYRPQNWYCLHVDLKATPEFREALRAVSSCFPNVFLASTSLDVRWGTFSVLRAELVCMQDLWQRNSRWKYFINLTGQEFPLRTNYELVRILSQAYRGANDITARVPSENISLRWRQFLPAPHNITLYKGAVHIVASRAFVGYVLHSPKARAFLTWCMKTQVPDEHFFNSLNHNPHLRVPGGSTGKVTIEDHGMQILNPSLARYKNWVPKYPCPGQKVVHLICILNVLDLPRLSRRKEMFANKFYAGYSRLALRCLAEALHNRTTEQALGTPRFNISFYQQHPVVTNRLWS